MPANCAVAGCNNWRRMRFNTYSYHRFPKDASLRKIWISRCGRPYVFNVVTSRICSVHFENTCFVRDLKSELLGLPSSRHILRDDAVPTLYLPSDSAPPGESPIVAAAGSARQANNHQIMKIVVDDKILDSSIFIAEQYSQLSSSCRCHPSDNRRQFLDVTIADVAVKLLQSAGPGRKKDMAIGSKLAAVLRKLHSATAVDSNSSYPADQASKPASPNIDELANPVSSPHESQLNSPASDNSLNEQFVGIPAVLDPSEVKDEYVIIDKLAERSSSSRRKQQKTRKVVDTIGDDVSVLPAVKNEVKCDQLPLQLLDSAVTPNSPIASTTSCQAVKVVNQNEEPDNDDASNDSFVLPEGTVFVQPESVDSSPAFQEIETSRTKGKFKGNLDTAIIHCTACHRQIGADANTTVCRHPVLKVLICKKCYKLYSSASIEQDADGSDEQCRWCGQGGDLICCDYCHNAICKTCIRRNLGRKELSNILNSDGERWRCYVCDPKPLLSLIEHCSAVMEALARQEKHELDRRRKPELIGKPPIMTQPSAQPVSVIQTAESATAVLAKTKMRPTQVSTFSTSKQQQALKGHMSAPTASTATETNTKPQFKGMKTVAALLREALPGRAPTSTSNMLSQTGSMPPRSLGPGSSRPPNSLLMSPTSNPVSVIDRLLQATNSMNVFLQSLRVDARRSSMGDVASSFDKRREIGGKLARAYAAYARSFQDAISSCQENSTPQTYMKNVRPVAAAGPAVLARPGANQVRMVNAHSVVRPSVMNVQPGRSVLNKQVLSRNSASGEVIELSDSDEEKNTSSSKVRSSTSVSGAAQTNLARSQQLNRVAVVQSAKSGSAQGVKAVTPVSDTVPGKRSRSPEHPSKTNDQSNKRVRLEEKSLKVVSLSSFEDGAMFDGDVDEIPAEDIGDSVGSDDHNLQMYCVDVDEDDSQLASTINTSSTLPNGKKIALRSQKDSSSTVSDFNRNVPGGKHISAS